MLEKTLGVPLFQEQAMQVAIIGAGFTPGEADELRRAMATFKFTGGVGEFRDKLIVGMRANGIAQEFAERLVKQIEGFGSYGFPESHAASFAKIAYASSWMKCHHPDVFCAALLNAQPMGFYAPAQIVRDAREHGVEVRPVCVLGQRVGYEHPTVAPDVCRGRPCREQDRLLPLLLGGCRDRPGLAPAPLRLGMRIVHGLAAADAGRILARAGRQPFTSVEDVWRRSGVPLATLEKLAKADAFAGDGARPAPGAVGDPGPGRDAAAAARRDGAPRGAGPPHAAHRRARGGGGLSRHPALAARAPARSSCAPS